MLGLHCCARVSSICGEWGLLFVVAHGLLLVVASLIVEHGSRCSSSVVVARGLSCPVAYGIFPDQGVNPCPLHWQVDSYSLNHQGSPRVTLKKVFFFLRGSQHRSLGTYSVPDPILEAGNAARNKTGKVPVLPGVTWEWQEITEKEIMNKEDFRY